MDTEVIYGETHLAKAGSSTGAGKTCTNNDNVELELVLWVHQALVSFIVGPFLSHWAFRNS